jgi:hypothetical protein
MQHQPPSATGQHGSYKAGTRPAAAARDSGSRNLSATNINVRWLLQQIPAGWQLEHIVAGASGMFGVLCLQCSDTAPQQQQIQQQQQQPVPWMAVVWDGAAWHIVGMYSSEQQARDGCMYVLDVGRAAAASSCDSATRDNLGSSGSLY